MNQAMDLIQQLHSMPDDEVRAFLMRIDGMIQLLEAIYVRTGVNDRLLKALVSSGMPTSPSVTQNVPVVAGAVPVLLARNDEKEIPFLHIQVTNIDPAAPIFYDGSNSVTVGNGQRLAAGQSRDMVVICGTQLYATCTAGTVNARVSTMLDPFIVIEALVRDEFNRYWNLAS